ncbi:MULTISPECIES: DUF4446 family protein [unclassified Clostridium]|uniref:DUF4446 family protein n=1 Tax=unclassified Clostridium TaxID=2614128 RepID=UPI0018972CF2|nr:MULTISPECIES: DUF4446 family protein [unclassified Clostridium]MBP3914413.1 DUF4446 family protein [Clostridium sp.]MEE0933668.1 DUF4446 family protein [Clostridium sp.]
MDSIINMINEYSIFIIIGLAIITLLLFIITIVLLASVKKLEKKYRKMMRGVNNKNLEQMLSDNLDNIEKALNKSQEAVDECKNISQELKGCVNKVAIMRYKAFEDVGSDLSFSIAILDSYNDGVIITGIYSRHDSTTYAKPIDKGISRYDLSEEELHVLNEAINSKN